jgi:hypothetical protein
MCLKPTNQAIYDGYSANSNLTHGQHTHRISSAARLQSNTLLDSRQELTTAANIELETSHGVLLSPPSMSKGGEMCSFNLA